jgi:hypothetical protein
MTAYFMNWKPDAEVGGEAAGLAFGDRVLDLVITYCDNGTFAWDVVDECESIATGTAASIAEARRAAERTARREALSLA